MAWISTSYKSSVLNMPVEAEILAPQSLGEDDKKGCKVIILLHGANNDRTEWLLKSQIFDMVKTLPVLVFMPSGKNSFYVNTANGYNYMDFISVEIPRFIKKMFPVSADKKDWLIAGASMGGYGALVCGLHHTEQFGNIASFSGAVDILSKDIDLPSINMELVFGKDRQAIADSSYNLYKYVLEVPQKERPRIMMNCGKQDGFYDMNLRFYDTIKDSYDVTYCDGDGKHNFVYWNERLKEMIPWFMQVGKSMQDEQSDKRILNGQSVQGFQETQIIQMAEV